MQSAGEPAAARGNCLISLSIGSRRETCWMPRADPDRTGRTERAGTTRRDRPGLQMTHTPQTSILALVALATLTACATAPLRSESTTSEIRAAEEVGAPDVPNAALHLQLAKEELATAEALAAKGDEEKADSMLERAHADAELAVALSHHDTEKKDANAALARVRELRSDHEGLQATTPTSEQ
jgi:hypothetical protein